MGTFKYSLIEYTHIMKLINFAPAGALLAGAAYAHGMDIHTEDWIPVLEEYGFNFGEESVTFESDMFPITMENRYDGKYLSIESPFYSHSHTMKENENLWAMNIKDKANGIWDQEMNMARETKLRMLDPKKTALDKRCQKAQNKNNKACVGYEKPPKYQDGYKYFEKFDYSMTTGNIDTEMMKMEQIQRVDINDDGAWTLIMKKEAWQFEEYFGKNLFKIENIFTENEEGQAVDYKRQAWKITSSCNLYGDWDIYGENKLISKEFDIDTDKATYNVAWTSNSDSMGYKNFGNSIFELENASACMQSWQNMQKLEPSYYGYDLSEYYKSLATEKDCIKRMEIVGTKEEMTEEGEPKVTDYNMGVEWTWNSPFDFSISYWSDADKEMKPFITLDLSDDYESIDFIFCGEKWMTMRPQETHDMIENVDNALMEMGYKQQRKWSYMWEYLKALDWEKEKTWELLTWHIVNHDYPLGKLDEMHMEVVADIKAWECGMTFNEKMQTFGVYLDKPALDKVYGHFDASMQYEQFRSASMLELLIEIRPWIKTKDPENDFIRENAWNVKAADMGFCEDRFVVLADDIKKIVENVETGEAFLDLSYRGPKSTKKLRKILKILKVEIPEEEIYDKSPEEVFGIVAKLVDDNLPEPEEIENYEQVESAVYEECDMMYKIHDEWMMKKVNMVKTFIQKIKAQQIADTTKYLGWLNADRSIFENLVDEIFQRCEDMYNGIWDCEFEQISGKVSERCETILATESGDYPMGRDPTDDY